ncbi:hypothetical protein jhhlp_007092, partial [Lomentospora prolificans]
AMALNRKYAALPDLDSAPDIYETPDLTDDNSTVPGTTLRSQSDAASDEDTAGEDGGISRQKLRINEARSRFESTRYNTAGVDFSDRVDSKRRSYRTRHRVLDDGTEELGDLSDEDDDTDEAAESLERKIARLKREVEEAKEEYARRRASGETKGGEGAGEEGLESLGRALEEISRPTGLARPTRLSKPLVKGDEPAPDQETIGEATYTVTYAPNYEQSHALAKAAEFDQRLLALEKSLGIGTTKGLEIGVNGLPRAVLPTVDTLNKQISVLAKASTANLDSISRRVRTLATDIENLNKAKAFSRSADQPNIERYVEERMKDDTKSKDASESEEDEQKSKINALYGTLATIESLTPLLQPLLDRLRSLRAIHADAATASETLDRIEKQQAEMAAELKQWKDGLEKISQAMKDGDAVMAGNMKVMESWIRDLEGRTEKRS